MTEHDFDLSSKDKEGRTLLMESVLRGSDAMVALLVERGINSNTQDNAGFSALHFAAQEYRVIAAEVLIRAGAKLELRDSFGNTPLWSAVVNSRGRGEMIKLLLKHGANPNSKNNHGKSPLDMANIVANFDLKQFFAEDVGPSL